MRFRFIHTGDLHLDSPLTGLSRHEDARAAEISKAPRKAFAELVTIAIERKVDAFLIAGDLWDGDWRDVSSGLFVQEQARRLSEDGIRVFAILGNHDAQSRVTERIRGVDAIHLFGTEAPTSVECGPATLHAMSYATPVVSENIALRYPDAVPARINVGLLHTSLDGRPGHETYAPCAPAELSAKGYDYWALGHVHTREVVQERPAAAGGTIAFCGVLQGRHVRETGLKGAYDVTIEDGRAHLEAIDLRHVTWFEALVDLSDGSEPREAIAAALRRTAASVQSDLAPVRLRLTGSTAHHHLLPSEARALLEEAQLVAQGLGGGAMLIDSLRLRTEPLETDAPRLPSHFEDFLRRAARDEEVLARAAAEVDMRLGQLGIGVRDALAQEEGLALGVGADPQRLARLLDAAAARVAARLSETKG